MINLDQVRTLEWKVKQAVQLIVQLRRENDMLSGRLADTEVRLQELEGMVETFKAAQSEMESGIRRSLDELDHLGPVDSSPAEPEAAETRAAESEAEATETIAEASEPAPVVSEPQVALEDEPPLESGVAEQAETPLAVELEPALEADEAFEEEYAALVAEEAASLVDPEPAAEAEAEPEKKTESERKPEQPGLGIF